MGWSPRAVISPQVAWSAATTFIALRVSYRAAVRVGQAGPCCSLFFGTSPPRSLLPSSTPLFALPLSLILYFPFPSADTSTTLIVLTNWCQDRGREGRKIPLVHHSQSRLQSLWSRLRHTPSGSPHSRSPHSFLFLLSSVCQSLPRSYQSCQSLPRCPSYPRSYQSCQSCRVFQPCHVFLPLPRFPPCPHSPHSPPFIFHRRPRHHRHRSQRAPTPATPTTAS
jgi:hypothetical protein